MTQPEHAATGAAWRPIPKRIIHLLSGGLDSVTMLHDLVSQGHFVHAVLFAYSQRHIRELVLARAAAIKVGVPYTTLEVPELGGLTSESWIVPNRNAILLSLAVNLAVKAKAESVTIGCNADDSEMFPDCRPTFIESFNELLRVAQVHVEVCAPYLTRRKCEIGAIAREMGIKSHDVWSCYAGGSSPCGECPACKNLNKAMP